MNNFTPGDWQVGTNHDEDGTEHLAVLAVMPSNDPDFEPDIQIVARLTSMANLTDEDRTNARLIAASKRLVEHGQALLAGLQERIRTAPENSVPVFDGIADFHAAINAALGLLDEQD